MGSGPVTREELIARYEKELERMLEETYQMHKRHRRQHYLYSLQIYLLGAIFGLVIGHWLWGMQ